MIVLDASALLAVVLREEDAAIYEEFLAPERGQIVMSPVNYVEAWMRVRGFRQPAYIHGLNHTLETLEITLNPITADQAELAIKAHESYGKGNHPARLNLGDCFAYALAKSRQMPLLFKGDDFRQTDIKAAL